MADTKKDATIEKKPVKKVKKVVKVEVPDVEEKTDSVKKTKKAVKPVPVEVKEEPITDNVSENITSEEPAPEVFDEPPAAQNDPKTEENKEITTETHKPKRGRKKKELSEEEKILKNTTFYADPVSLAPKEQRKALRRTEHIIAENGERELNMEDNVWMDEYKELAGSAESGRVLKGELAGMRHADPGNIESTLIADIKFKTGALQVNIPVDLLFDYDENSFRGEGGARQLEEAVRSRITGEVRFVVRSVDQKTGIAYADSLRAQAQVTNNYYIHNAPKQKHPRIIMKKDADGNTVGPLVHGRVVSVNHAYIIVDAIGPEVRIGLNELSYLHITDPRNLYSVNDEITIRLLSIETEKVKKRDNEYVLVKATGSVKQVYPDNTKQYYDNFEVEGVYSATITYIDDQGHVYCSLKDQYDCRCKFPVYGSKPIIGQKRVVKVISKNDEKGFIYGTFIS